MKPSVCHYSFHRTWTAEKWTCDTLADVIKDLGVGAVDFHVRFLGDPDSAAERITKALERTGLALSGLSMSNNFNQEDRAELDKQVQAVKTWLKVAAAVEAPASRIFGGHIGDRSDKAQLDAGMERIEYGLRQVAEEAERLGVVLALENHGGLPCTGEEQVAVIEKIGSQNLRATVDVGNYLQGDQKPEDGTRVAAPYAAYVHFKDFVKTDDPNRRFGLAGSTVGEGIVDHAACLAELAKAGFSGYVALEYEGSEDEREGVRKSLEYMRKVMAGY